MPLFGIVNDNGQDVALAETDTAHAVTHIDAVKTTAIRLKTATPP